MAVHFISGMPRSGSTLLAAILRQNHRFVTGITSPVGELWNRALGTMGAGSEYHSMFYDARRKEVLRGIFDGYYRFARKTDAIVFDTNRYWCARMDLVAKVFPEAKLLVCVREAQWIFDSFERAIRAHPLLLSKLYPAEANANVYSRADHAAHPSKGVLGFGWYATKEAYYGPHRDRMHIVEYEALARYPHHVMASIYKFLDLTYESGQHSFENVNQLHEVGDFDFELGLPGLHTVRPKVEFLEEKTVLPPDLFKKLSWPIFWREEKEA